ncbi:hypothetical protein lbkm_0006 [Lachnospiraceae bacterium KM106-2]|nr:hypothetical protein lbkm_0006 [Lachnospiraceae bacterium KM106-2]
MQQRLLNDLQDAGNSIEKFVIRMGGNETFVLMMMKKFLNDPTFVKLQNSLKVFDYEEIENSAHTLKGVALNLGFDSLSEHCKELQSAAKNKNQLLVRKCNKDVRCEYEKIVSMIQEE